MYLPDGFLNLAKHHNNIDFMVETVFKLKGGAVLCPYYFKKILAHPYKINKPKL